MKDLKIQFHVSEVDSVEGKDTATLICSDGSCNNLTVVTPEGVFQSGTDVFAVFTAVEASADTAQA